MTRDDFTRRAFRASVVLTIALMPLTWLSSFAPFALSAAWLLFLAIIGRRHFSDDDTMGFLVGLVALLILPQAFVEDVRNGAHGYRTCDERCKPFDGKIDDGRCLCERESKIVQRFAPADGKGP